MSKVIDRFTDEYFFLSNFYPHGSLTKTVEHQFQAAKATNKEDSNWVLSAKNPNEAKKRGKIIQLRSDWEAVKIGVMARLLEEKFQDPDLRAKLLATGKAKLIEGNWWGDRFWGVYHGQGENWLGKLLMQLRDQLQKGEQSDGR